MAYLIRHNYNRDPAIMLKLSLTDVPHPQSLSVASDITYFDFLPRPHMTKLATELIDIPY